jgi:hypothetical protein
MSKYYAMDNPEIQSILDENARTGRLQKSTASYGFVGRTFENIAPNKSVKSQYGKGDYEYFRQNEMVPKNPREILEVCNRAYKEEGIIRNTIDLMAEFACKGVQVLHPNKRNERLGKQWFEYVNGKHVSERFLNLFYRLAQTPVAISYGTIPVTIEKKWASAYGGNQIKSEKVVDRRIPIKYEFYNPLSVQMINPTLSALTGKPMYGLVIPVMLRSEIENAKRTLNAEQMKELLGRIPEDILKAVMSTNNSSIITLDDENFCMFYYKKDDWETFATPMIYSILPEIINLQKMKLADRSALDGAISNIRLWTLGKIGNDPSSTILPGKAALQELQHVLSNNVGGGTVDLVWDATLSFQESQTQVHHFLGMEKYEPLYRGINNGLGIPSSISGGGEGGFNNTFVEMQTFIERLEYGRMVLARFWNQELKKVQQALGISRPFQIGFDEINLGDVNNVKKLLMDMVDRDIISMETLLEKCNIFSNVEKERIKREYKARVKESIPDKASPFHQPQTDEELRKIIVNQGLVTPSEVGIDLKPRKEGETTLIEQQAKLQSKKYKPTNLNNGRPKGKTDSQKRKKKAVKVSKTISLSMWANNAQKKISEIVTPVLVKSYGKSDVRALTVDESQTLENTKLTILTNVQPFENIDEAKIFEITNASPKIDNEYATTLKNFARVFSEENSRQPSLEEMRMLQASAYAFYHLNKNNE